jgi:hypothetical protein
MPRTTRNEGPGEQTGARRPGQDAGTAALAEREPAGRGARRSTGPTTGGADAQATPGTPAAAGQRPGEAQPGKADPAYDDIARRAYELYQQRGGEGGQEVDDWLRAESELREGRGRRDDET